MGIRKILLIALFAVLTFGIFSTAEANTRLKVTNYVRVTFPIFDIKIVDKDEIPAEIVTTEEAGEEEFDDDEYTDGEEINPIEENYELFPAQSTTTVILDTERGADGTPLRRHVYFYDRFVEPLTIDSSRVLGYSKIEHLSFAADEVGLTQWRQELTRLFAFKNKAFLNERNAQIESLEKKFKKVKNKGENEEYLRAYYEMEDNLVRSLEIDHAIVLLKPMGAAEYGDVVDAMSILNECQIKRYQPEKVSHTDSVMVFNSLYPMTDMAAGVDFYTFGKPVEHPSHFDFITDLPEGYNDIDPNRFLYELEYDHDPLLVIEVAPGKNHAEDASVAVLFNDEMFKEWTRARMEDAEEYEVQVEDEPEEDIDPDMLLNRLVEEYGINSKKVKRIEVESVDSEMNDLINEFKIVADHYRLYNDFQNGRNIWLHADRHIPYAIVECVIDCFTESQIQKLTLAY